MLMNYIQISPIYPINQQQWYEYSEYSFSIKKLIDDFLFFIEKYKNTPDKNKKTSTPQFPCLMKFVIKLRFLSNAPIECCAIPWNNIIQSIENPYSSALYWLSRFHENFKIDFSFFINSSYSSQTVAHSPSIDFTHNIYRRSVYA